MVNKKPQPKGIFPTMVTEFMAIFDMNVCVNTPAKLSFAERNTISICLAYYVGFWCLDMSAIAAGTCSVLLSSFSGSALIKNLGRLQSVVIATIVPHIIT